MSKKRERAALGSSLRAPDWARINVVPHVQPDIDVVQNLDAKKAEKYRAKHNITCIADTIPSPVISFLRSPFPKPILAAVRAAGFKRPTPIQAQGWPVALTGSDLVGIADTGTGKTLAFLLPAIVHINAQPPHQPGEGPIVLIITPTRELALQILGECAKFGHACNVTYTCLYGGVPKREQAIALKKGVTLAVATPGRLIDFLENRATNLRRVTYLVLDEADRMLDMGFEQAMRVIMSQIRPSRQVLLFTATWPDSVQSVAREFTNKPVQINIGSLRMSSSSSIRQEVKVCSEERGKKQLLERTLEECMDGSSILIFTATKAGTDTLTLELRQAGWPARALHGDKTQAERDWVLSEFRDGTTPIMVATDVASRGLDVESIRTVINYDFPKQIQDYVHRIGRTGRAGMTGRAITFFVPERDGKRAPELIRLLRDSKQTVPPDLLRVVNPDGEEDVQDVGASRDPVSSERVIRKFPKYSSLADRAYFKKRWQAKLASAEGPGPDW